MALTLGNAPKPTGNSKPCPPGNHCGRCFSVVDLGTHTTTGQYGTKTNRKIRVAWEFPEETHVFDEKKGPEPYVTSKTYNFVLGEKSNLLNDLQAWRGQPFTDEELMTFELKKLIGQVCMVQVIQQTKGDKTYANVEAITTMPKKFKEQMPAAVNAPIYYELDMGQGATFQALPEFLQKLIKTCNEWGGKPEEQSQVPAGDNPPLDQREKPPATGKGPTQNPEDEDSIPFAANYL